MIDPKTIAWLQKSLEPTFGYPSLVRFSWTTVKVALDKSGHSVKWYAVCSSVHARSLTDNSRIDDGEASLIDAFQSSSGRDKDRCAVTKDLCIRSVGML